MVEIFKTNVHEEDHASSLLDAISISFPAIKVNFDLEDCDRILKVEGEHFKPEHIVQLLHDNGYHCEVLA